MAEISVIMPAYNVAAYVGAAMDSVIAQTVRDWELLVVDDGSTDGTPDIVAAYAARDGRIRLLTQANRGCAAARNLALGVAAGRFIAFLDSDDLWDPSFLAAQLRLFEEDDAVDIVTGNAWFLGGPQHGLPARPWPDARPAPTLRSILGDEAAIFIMSVMRREVYEAIGGFDESLRTGEDYEFWVRAAASGFRFRRNGQPLGHYRRRDDSLSASDVRMLTGALTVYEKLRITLRERPEAVAIVESQIERLQAERVAAEFRAAVRARWPWRPAEGAPPNLAWRLLRICAAGTIAHWAPRLLGRASKLRRPRPEVAS